MQSVEVEFCATATVARPIRAGIKDLITSGSRIVGKS